MTLSALLCHLATGVGEDFGLTDVVTPDVLRPLSSDGTVQEQLEPHIPQTSESVTDVLTSPQFQQALGVFGSALQSGQLGPLMSQFGMGQDVVNAANTGSMLSVFLFFFFFLCSCYLCVNFD